MRIRIPEYNAVVNVPDGTDPAEVEKLLAGQFPPKKGIFGKAKDVAVEAAKSTIGGLETAGALGTGIGLGFPAGLIGGTAKAITSGLGEGLKTFQDISGALTYQPQTEYGQMQAGGVEKTIGFFQEPYAGTAEKVGTAIGGENVGKLFRLGTEVAIPALFGMGYKARIAKPRTPRLAEIENQFRYTPLEERPTVEPPMPALPRMGQAEPMRAPGVMSDIEVAQSADRISQLAAKKKTPESYVKGEKGKFAKVEQRIVPESIRPLAEAAPTEPLPTAPTPTPKGKAKKAPTVDLENLPERYEGIVVNRSAIEAKRRGDIEALQAETTKYKSAKDFRKAMAEKSDDPDGTWEALGFKSAREAWEGMNKFTPEKPPVAEDLTKYGFVKETEEVFPITPKIQAPVMEAPKGQAMIEGTENMFTLASPKGETKPFVPPEQRPPSLFPEIKPDYERIAEQQVAAKQTKGGFREGERGSISRQSTEPVGDITKVADPVERAVVSEVENLYAATRKAMKERNKITGGRVRDWLVRNIVDVSGNAKRALVERAGDLGKKAKMDRDLISGATAKAGEIIENAHDTIYGGLNERQNWLLNQYLDARRTIDIEAYKPGHKRAGGVGGAEQKIYLKHFQDIHNLTPEQMRSLEGRATQYFDVMRQQVNDLYDNGIIKAEVRDNLLQHDYLRTDYLEYIDPDAPTIAPARRINVPQTGIKKFKEGSTGLTDINTERIMQEVVSGVQSRIFKNRANNSLYDIADKMPDNGIVSIQPIKNGVELSMWRDGDKYTFFADPKFAKDWVMSDPQIKAGLAEALQWMSGAKILKAFATGYNPFFWMSNMPRDMALIWQTAEGKTAGYSSFGPRFLGQMAQDLWNVKGDVFKRKGKVKDFVNEGGEMALLTHYGKFRGQGVLTERINSLSDLMSWAGETSELWTRIALRERAIKSGMTPKEATHLARNYLDFSQGGTAIKAVDTVLPYFNAAVQGTRSLLRGAKENPGRFAYQSAQLATVATGLYFMNETLYPDLLKSIPAKVRNDNFIIGTPFKYTDNQGQERNLYFKISKDQGQRVITSAIEALAEYGKTGELPIELMTEGAKDFINANAASLLPPTMKGVFSYLYNKDFWTGLDVWRGPKMDVASEEWTTRTDPFFKALGQATSLSPERLETGIGAVVPMNNPFVSLGMGGLKAILGELPKELQEKATIQLMTENPSIRRVLSATEPFEPYRKEFEQAKGKAARDRYVVDREWDKLLEDYMKDRSPENRAKMAEFASKQSDVDLERMTERAERRIAYYNIPDRTWWDQLAKTDPETRAQLFWNKFSKADQDSKERMLNRASELPGVLSDRFVDKLAELAQ